MGGGGGEGELEEKGMEVMARSSGTAKYEIHKGEGGGRNSTINKKKKERSGRGRHCSHSFRTVTRVVIPKKNDSRQPGYKRHPIFHILYQDLRR